MPSANAVRTCRYRFATTFRARVGGYVTLLILVALLGGVAMTALAAARRTQSSYPTFLRSTEPTDLTFSTYGLSGDPSANAYSPRLAQAIARLPEIRKVESWVGIFVAPLKPDGAPALQAAAQLNIAGSLDGLYFDEDRATAIRGRMADPQRDDEFVTTELGAQLMGWHVGQVVPMGVFEPAQAGEPGFGTPAVPPLRRIAMHLTGLVVFNNEVVEDDADRLPTNVLFTPALTRPLVAKGDGQGTWFGLQLVHGGRDVTAVEKELLALLPPGNVGFFRVTSIAESKVEDAIRPEAIALGVFGAIAGLAALVIAALAIPRLLAALQDDHAVMRGLGASPGTIMLDGLAGLFASIVVGAFVAVAIAVALSPLAPLGPGRRVYPHRGFAADTTVLGVGFAVLVGVLVIVALAVAHRRAPHRLARTLHARPRTSGGLARAAASAGLPAPAVIGVRFATDPGRGRAAVPVRSALLGTTVAVVLVMATVTFGGSLHTLVGSPPLYGWNWNSVLYSVNDVPPPATAMLAHDHDVETSGYVPLTIQIDGRSVAALIGDDAPTVAPPVLTGRGLEAKGEIVLGAATLAALHKHLGDAVTVTFGMPSEAPFYVPPTTVNVVGTVTMPALTTPATLADHPTMGEGAVVSRSIAPAAFIAAVASPDPTLNGPADVLVRYRPGANRQVADAEVQRAADAGNRAFDADPQAQGDTVAVLGIQRPAEIVNYRSTGATPDVLAAGLVSGALVALGLTLIASVRSRRRELALLKTLGFTRRQLAGTVAAHATVVAVISVGIGTPLGVAAGRWLWILFADRIYAVPRPVIPSSVAVLAFALVVLTNVIATVPGRIASRTPAAAALRDE